MDNQIWDGHLIYSVVISRYSVVISRYSAVIRLNILDIVAEYIDYPIVEYLENHSDYPFSPSNY